MLGYMKVKNKNCTKQSENKITVLNNEILTISQNIHYLNGPQDVES